MIVRLLRAGGGHNAAAEEIQRRRVIPALLAEQAEIVQSGAMVGLNRQGLLKELFSLLLAAGFLVVDGLFYEGVDVGGVHLIPQDTS